MSNSGKKRARWALVIGVLALLPVWAVDSNIARVTVKVKIITPPPCTINDNQPIEVDFGDVLTTRVDGVNYRKPIEYRLVCPADQLIKNTLKLQIQGPGINLGGGTTALAVPKVADFGIQLQHETAALGVNTWLNFTYTDINDTPNLYAVPVKRAGSTLAPGEFTASSTMTVEYQ
ncbi:fimbrial protein [uncultured Cedecea sp.]|uniref:fimbrial protein n=1 Tax=uncultured Cedecea sp. TaxID=988762 RepID=UPI0026086AEE|nr:fimbrial protein [uncultured Cedecea sp.]